MEFSKVYVQELYIQIKVMVKECYVFQVKVRI